MAKFEMAELSDYSRIIDRKVARAIRYLAEFFFLSQAEGYEQRAKELGVSITSIRSPVFISLYALGYEDISWKQMHSAEAIAEMAGRIHVDHGQQALEAFYFWQSWQMLLSLLNNASKHGCKHTIQPLFWMFVDPLFELGLYEDVAAAIDAIEDLINRSSYLSRKRASEARNLLLEEITPIAELRLGLVNHLCRGVVSGSTLSYPKVYRLAKHAGQIEAAQKTSDLISNGGHETRRHRFELNTIVDRLGIKNSVPRGVRCVRRALTRLVNPDFSVTSNDMGELFNWIQVYLDVVFGAQSEHVYRIARELGYASFFLEHYDDFKNLVPKSCERLFDEISDVASPSVRANFNEILLQPERTGKNRISTKRDLESAVGQIETWFSDTIPLEERTTARAAQIVVQADTFRTYWSGVDRHRIDAFLKQFPQSLEWFGEDLLSAIDYYDDIFFVNALSSMIEESSLVSSKNVSLCLLGGARKSTAHMCYALRRNLRLDYGELRFILSQRRKRRIILFIDDCLLSGTQSIHILSELIGVWTKHPYKYEVPFSKAEKTEFKNSKLFFFFALGTNLGLFRLREFLGEEGIDHEIRCAIEIPWLSRQGMQDLNDGILVDASGCLSAPTRQLAQPIFSPWARLERPAEWEQARDFCAAVGYSLLDRYAKEGNWSDSRRRGSSLGYSGVQGRIVFSHNIPKTTLTLLWASGEYEGKPWIPLFPARD